MLTPIVNMESSGYYDDFLGDVWQVHWPWLWSCNLPWGMILGCVVCPRFLYIWYGHYARKVVGWRLLTTKNPVQCHVFFFFSPLFVTSNFCKLLFTRQGGKVSCFRGFVWLFMGRGCAFIYLFWCLLLLNGRGWRLMFFFLLHLTCARRRGRGLVFFVFFFFIIEWLWKGVMVFFSFDMLKGDGRGSRLIFFWVGLIHFIL